VRFPVVLFDFDGTIVDSEAIIRESFLQTAAEAGIPLDPEQLPDVYRSGPLEVQMAVLDASRADALVARYREINAALHTRLAVFPGMLPLLETLRAEGRRVGIVSAKRRTTVDLAFAVLPIQQLFDVVVGSEDTERHKPDPAPLLHALDRLGARPEDAAYVGDAPMDVECARAAGVHAVAVTWGGLFPVAQTLAAAPDAVAHTPEELLALV
jgi:pyrophosphatase PpaX